MRRDLSGLMQVVKRQREASTKNRCATCRNEAIKKAVDLALADIKRNPKKYAGVTQGGLWEWSGARAAGIKRDAFRKHIEVHIEGGIAALAATR